MCIAVINVYVDQCIFRYINTYIAKGKSLIILILILILIQILIIKVNQMTPLQVSDQN